MEKINFKFGKFNLVISKELLDSLYRNIFQINDDQVPDALNFRIWQSRHGFMFNYKKDNKKIEFPYSDKNLNRFINNEIIHKDFESYWFNTLQDEE